MSKGKADRSSGVLTVRCPVCGVATEFPDFDEVDIFICACGEPVEVEDTVN